MAGDGGGGAPRSGDEAPAHPTATTPPASPATVARTARRRRLATSLSFAATALTAGAAAERGEGLADASQREAAGGGWSPAG